MKKLLALALTLVMVLSLSVTAFAAETDQTSITFAKEVAGTGAPDETYQFKLQKEGQDVSGCTGSVNGAGDVTIPLPNIADIGSEPGVVEYGLVETDNATAGMTYATSYKVKVWLYRDDTNGGALYRVAKLYNGSNEKAAAVTNTYSAGSLAVTKVVTGNMGDRSKEFNVTVTFTAPEGKTVRSTISYTDNGEGKTIAPGAWSGNTASASITLKHDETVTFENIPYGVTYTVVEDNYQDEDYTTTTNYSDDTNKKIDTATDTVTITNKKSATVDTGIALDSLPYVLLLAVSLVGMAAFVMKKRAEREF